MDRRRSHAEEAPLAAGIPEAPPASLVLAPPEAAAPTQTAKRSLAQEPRANETRSDDSKETRLDVFIIMILVLTFFPRFIFIQLS